MGPPEPAHHLTWLFGKHPFLGLHLCPSRPFVVDSPVPFFLSPIHQFGRGGIRKTPGKNMHHLAPIQPHVDGSGCGRDAVLLTYRKPALEGVQGHSIWPHSRQAIGGETTGRQFGVNGVLRAHEPVQTNAKLGSFGVHGKIESRRHPHHVGNRNVLRNHVHSFQAISKSQRFPVEDVLPTRGGVDGLEHGAHLSQKLLKNLHRGGILSGAELEDVFTPKGPKRRVGMLEVGELFGLIVALGKRVQDIHPLRFPERIWELHARHLNGVWGRIATVEQGQRENPHRNVEQVAWGKG